MNRLRNRLILVFVVATLLPLGLTLWTMLNLLERSLNLAPLAELDAVAQSLEKTGRELYKDVRELLRRDAAEGRIEPRKVKPADAPAFWESKVAEQFERAGEQGDRLDYYVRKEPAAGRTEGEVWIYSRPMGVAMADITRRIQAAHEALPSPEGRDFRRGFTRTLMAVAAALWLLSLAAMVYVAHRISRFLHLEQFHTRSSSIRQFNLLHFVHVQVYRSHEGDSGRS